MPIYHEVFDGNAAEAPTVLPTVCKVLARYPHVRRLVMVADRGLLSVDNLAELTRITLPSGQALEFILAVPGRRSGEFVELLGPLHDAPAEHNRETITESRWGATA
jgi:transposase